MDLYIAKCWTLPSSSVSFSGRVTPVPSVLDLTILAVRRNSSVASRVANGSSPLAGRTRHDRSSGIARNLLVMIAPYGVRGESTEGRVASAAGPDARRRPAGDVDVHRRGPPTTQMAPRRRNPEGAWVLRAIAALLLLDDPHRDRLRRRALRSPHNTHARDPLYFHHG